jgi:hypothetical protein
MDTQPQVIGDAIERPLDRAAWVRIDGLVWCLTHGEAHGHTTNPYEMEDDECSPDDHRAIAWRGTKGDYR